VDNDLRRLYVADIKAARLAIFDLDSLKFIRFINNKAPSREEPHGILGTPTNVAIDPDGLVYVVDTIPNRVEIFDTDGNYVRGFGEQGNVPGKFARPKGIAIDSDGHVYVADDEFNNIQVFTSEGQVLMAVSHFGAQPGQFLLLTGLAFDQHNHLAATDAMGRVELFQYITEEEVAGSGPSASPAERSSAGSQSVASGAPIPAKGPAGADKPGAPQPTVEQLQKELEELKAKLAAQQQQSKKQQEPKKSTAKEPEKSNQ
jgi:DNA-binding beta-propeller fold protein YncE